MLSRALKIVAVLAMLEELEKLRHDFGGKAGCVGGGRIFRASAKMHTQQDGVLSTSKVSNELYSFDFALFKFEI